MSRLEPYLGIAAALFVGLLVGVISYVLPKGPLASKSHDTAASSTLSVVPSFDVPALPTPSLSQVSEETSTSSSVLSVEQKVVAPAPKPVTTAVATTSSVPVAAPVVVPPQESSGDGNLDASAAPLRAALVNIICYTSVGSGLHSISGSGVFIDPKGIILTNAHIAQYFLLADRGAHCTIRSGSPAVDRYTAALIYLPQPWLQANATVLTQSEPSGTGEYDFALLAVTGGIKAAPPASFPFVPLALSPPSKGTPVVIASYGAQFLESSQIQSALFPTVVFGSVKDVFTFHTTTIDVLALGGSAAAQEGSSGGGVSDATGGLVGTITTSTVTGATATRSLSAITASYVRGEYASETGSPIDALLAEQPLASVASFALKAPALEAILTEHLP